jgi:hypothetical protein
VDFSGGASMKRLAFFHRTLIGKIFLALLGVIGVITLILFTPSGNRLMTPVFEHSLSTMFSAPVTLRELTLRYNRFDLIAQDTSGNTLSAQGGFSLLTLRLYAHYRLECFREGGINPIRVPFKTEGALNGGIAALNIHGDGDIFEGHILYESELHRFHLASLHLALNNIAYEPLLHLFDYPCDTDTKLNGTLDLKGFDLRDVKGSIHLVTKTDHFKPTPIKEDDNTSFDLKSLLADEYGVIKPFNVNITMDASLAHAGILEQFVGMPLGGEIRLNASLSGNQKLMQLKIDTPVAQSETSIHVNIPDLEPSTVAFDFKHADLEQTFTLFSLSAPLSGKSDLYGELNTTGGNIHVIVTQGLTIPKVLRQEYQITQPLIHFNGEVTADISEKEAHYHATFKSDLSRMEIDNTTTHDQMLRDLLKTIPSGSPHR